MQELKMGDYINSPSLSNHEDPRKTEKKSSDSVSGVFRVVGVSFGLLCVLQATLNISLRLHNTSVPCHTAPNATADWAVEDLVEMRYLLVGQRRQLDKDHDDLEARYQDCSRRRWSKFDNPRLIPDRSERRMIDSLRDQISQQNIVIKDLERQRYRLQIRLQKLDPLAPRCPADWISELSSCYLLSSSKSTWDLAQQDCRNRGAHLVTVNSKEEQMLIQTVGYLVDRVWIGLRLSGTNQVPAWEDGTPLQTGFWNMGGESRTMGCVYVDQGVKTEDSWVNAPCELLNNWLCEKAMVS